MMAVLIFLKILYLYLLRSSPSNVAFLTLITAINCCPIFFKDEKGQYYIKYTSYIHAGCPIFFANSLSYNLTYLTLITHHPIFKHVTVIQLLPSNVALLTLNTAINLCQKMSRMKKCNIILHKINISIQAVINFSRFSILHILHSLPTTPFPNRFGHRHQMMPFLHLLQLLTAVQFFLG